MSSATIVVVCMIGAVLTKTLACLVFCIVGGMGRNQVTKEDDGYLLVMTMNSAEMASYLLIFDARDIVQGPLHRLRMPVTIAHGLHGNFVPDLTFDFNEVKRKFKVKRRFFSFAV